MTYPRKLIPVCSNCNRPWNRCNGTCLITSSYSNDPVLSEISKWAEEYISKLEVELTEDHCLCEWIYRDGKPKQIEVTTQLELAEGKQSYLPGATPRLRIRSTEHPECPVHTRRGLLVGFYQWATTEKDFIALWSVAEGLRVCADEESIEKSISDNEEDIEGDRRPGDGEHDLAWNTDEIERL